MHLIVGLGNPGRRYEDSRHNAGFLVVDRIAARWRGSCDQNQLGALVGRSTIGDRPAILAKPQGYMNLSGQPVASLRGYYKVAPQNVVVVHDDLDLAFGQVRVKNGGGHGGHNGLRDLNEKIGNGYVRVRVGVSRPPPEWDSADYVLAPWSKSEREQLDEIVDRAADAVDAVVQRGVEAAMNEFNVRPGKGRAQGGPNA